MKRFSFGDYQLNTMDSEFLYRGEAVPLEPQVYCILEFLISRHGQVVSRDEIIKDVWDGRFISKHVLDNRIRAARAAIGDTDKVKRYIKTYPNRGYKFVGEVTVLNGNASLSDLESCEQLSRADPGPDPIKRPFFQFGFTPKYIFGAVLSLFLGLFVFQSSFGSKGLESGSKSAVFESSERQDLNLSDENKRFSRIAILPFETIGENPLYSYLPDVLESEFNQTITAINDLTVVSFYAKTDSLEQVFKYNTLRSEFDLDYVIVSKLATYGQSFKLTVSLIRTEDSSVLSSETYNLDVSNADNPRDLFADIAPKVTLMTANKLNLSLGELPSSWKNYAFYAKLEKAEALYDEGDYESTMKAAELYREVLEEEPNYLPAYLHLIFSLSAQNNFSVVDDNSLLKELAELILKMREISPGAPETQYINAATGYVNEDGVYIGSVGEDFEFDVIGAFKHLLEKDPDNSYAMSALAYASEFLEDQSDTVMAYKNALELAPTKAWLLSSYSYALLCNENFSKSRDNLNRASKWHPDHRHVLMAQMRHARALGEYEDALTSTRKLLDQGIISQEESDPMIILFDDLGHPELTLPHIRFAPNKARVYAKMGEKDAALKNATVIEVYYESVRAKMIVQDNYYPEDYFPAYTYENVGEPDDTTKANMCRLDDLARDAYVLDKVNSDKSDDFLALLVEYYEGKDPQSFNIRQEYTGLMALHILQGNHDKAIEVMDIAMERGFLFVGSFKEPFLRDLTTHPGLSERLETMKRSADRLIEEFYAQ